MKYWLLTTEYPPRSGGIGTYTIHTSRMLRDEGHDVTVFIYDSSLAADKIITDDGIRIIRFLPKNDATNRFLGFDTRISFEYARVIRQYMKTEGVPDMLESQEYLGISYFIQQYKLLGYENFKNLHILITCHAPSFICLEYNQVPVYQFPAYWIGVMEKNCIRSADVVITPTRYFVHEAKKRMDWIGVREACVPNPVYLDNSSMPNAYKHGHLVSFGKLSPLKGSFALLEYFSRLWENGFSYPLHVIGSDQQIFHPERIKMGELIRRKYQKYLQTGQLVLHGEMLPDEAQAFLAQAHVVIVPSLFDNLPYTVLEAMSWGKVVLASRQGGQSEIINDGQNGFLFDHDKKDDFQAKLTAILELSAEELNRLAVNATRTIRENYSPALIYRKKMEVLKEYLQERPLQRKLFPFLETTPVSNAAVTDKQPGMKNTLSVVIPYYNMGTYIEDCVVSILDAAPKDTEILIINDGSTEQSSLDALANIEKRYNVIVYTKNNSGLPNVRNYGAERATGEFLAFLDADDTVENLYYQRAIELFNRYSNVHFVGCWTRYFGEGNGAWPAFTPEPPLLLLHNMINSSSLVFRKHSFLKYGLNDERFSYGMEDWESVVNMVENNCRGVVLPEMLFNYRVRNGSMARKFTRVKRLYLYSLMSAKHENLYKQYAVELFNLLEANGSSILLDNPSLSLPAGYYMPFLSGRWQETMKDYVKQNRFIRRIAYTVYKLLKN